MSIRVDPAKSAVLGVLLALMVLAVPSGAMAAPAPSFGLKEFSFGLQGSSGGASVQAGGHPNLVTSFVFNQGAEGVPVGNPRHVGVVLPAGVIGDPLATGVRCTVGGVSSKTCPESSAVGVAEVDLYLNTEPGHRELHRYVSLIYDIAPYEHEPVASEDEPAAFAFNLVELVVRIDASVSGGDGYRVATVTEDLPEAFSVVSSKITFWGVPAEHNGPGTEETGSEEEVGSGKFNGNGTSFGGPGQGPKVAFLRSPTSCTGSPLDASLTAIGWPEWVNGQGLTTFESSLTGSTPGMEGCSDLSFDPGLSTSVDSHQTGEPAGYTFGLSVPQSESSEVPATPDVRDVSVTLPAGTVISPSTANGLEACTPAQFELSPATPGQALREASCPRKSQLGSVKITTPLLEAPLEGQVFLGEPECEPCSPQDATEGKLAPLLLQAQGSGVLIKLEGHTSINQSNGQLTTTFDENPQLPFSDLVLTLEGGPRAALANPETCGNAVTVGHIAPWSALTSGGVPNPEEVANVTAEGFQVTGCTAKAFLPSIEAQMTDTGHAGAFSPFSVSLSRPDAQQSLGSVILNTPPGLLGVIAHVTQCDEADANAGTCPASSQIGEATTIAGPGSEPVTVPGGRVYLTGPYGGGPFGLSIVVPSKAGPVTLAGTTGKGTVIVRASINVNPNTTALTIATGSIPTVLDGIPLDIDRVIVNVNRPEFMLNPTNCNPQQITGTVTSSTGAQAGVSYPFQANDCGSLPFAPTFTASTQASTSKADGASLTVKVNPLPGQANIAKVDLTLPKQLPARLTTLQKACTEAQFNANPAGCPEASDIGTAVAHTPILSSPLQGPAYLVSHGGAAFPDVEFVLQGENGVQIVLDGGTQIKNGITYSKFETVPDAPITSFETVLPEGPHSVLATDIPASAKYSLCGQSLQMPTTITGQNGVVVNQTTNIAVTGCKAVKTKPLTRAQKLAAALKKCRAKYKARKRRSKRVACEKAARKRFGPKAKAKSKRGKTGGKKKG